MMMPSLPPEVLAALMGEPVEYEEPSTLQMLTPSIGLGAAGIGVGAAGGMGWPRVAPYAANIKANLAAKAAPMMARMNPMRLFGKRASAHHEEDRGDPSGAIGLILKAMRRIGRSNQDPRMVMAFERLARNVPTNKRPY